MTDFSLKLCNAITNRDSCTLQLHWCSQPLSQQRFPDNLSPYSTPISLYRSQVSQGWSASCCEGKKNHWLGNRNHLFLRGNSVWQLHNCDYYELNLLDMCKALSLFKTPFYTQILIKMRFYRCIYRHSIIKHKLFPSQRIVFLVLLFLPTNGDEASPTEIVQ